MCNRQTWNRPVFGTLHSPPQNHSKSLKALPKEPSAKSSASTPNNEQTDEDENLIMPIQLLPQLQCGYLLRTVGPRTVAFEFQDFLTGYKTFLAAATLPMMVEDPIYLIFKSTQTTNLF